MLRIAVIIEWHNPARENCDARAGKGSKSSVIRPYPFSVDLKRSIIRLCGCRVWR
ncbi:hypothetical protein NSU_3416 [Novosphingobium pentaromativorans US6-1]|uniref:Uncharacterized protein n=1 Tax=Novosphingobium pentaromativorans US6-1 TaxID=1088721 RepID=G6EGI6_9SPHN|nr:hypothetical protein NSU_3416 [Novosphingobium pentaromativorans US6-1]